MPVTVEGINISGPRGRRILTFVTSIPQSSPVLKAEAVLSGLDIMDILFERSSDRISAAIITPPFSASFNK